jgi:hypothetical protein
VSRWRRNPVVQRIDGQTWRLVLAEPVRASIDRLLDQLAELLEEAPDDPSLHRLHPTAYGEDPERDRAYQLLAGEELRTRRQATIAAVRATLHQPGPLHADDLWAWVQALNALRLVLGTRLGIDDDHAEPPMPASEALEALHEAYQFATALQHYVVEALDADL